MTFDIESTFFAIDDDGIVTTLQMLNREINDSYSIVVIATDEGDPPLSSNISISVTVLDENDEYPIFVEPPTRRFTVRERAANGTYLGTVVAIDDDEVGTVNSEVTYSIVGGSGLELFAIDNSSGNVTLVMEIDLVENTTSDSYVITIAASDQGMPRRTTEQNFTIDVLDIDDNVPQFVTQNYNFDITEGNTPDAFVGRVEAVDLDPHNRSIGYSIDTNTTLFIINATTGEIFANGVIFNRSIHDPDYTIVVVTYFQDDPSVIYDTAYVFITVADRNDFGVRIVSYNSSIYIDENTPVNETIGFVVAGDADPDSELEYSLTTDQDVLRIDQDSGVIFINKEIDREDETLFPLGNDACPAGTEDFISCLTFNILVLDSNNPDDFGLSRAYASGTLFVRDLDDTPPTFTQDVYNATINESLSINTGLVGLNILAEDRDFNILPKYSIPPDQNVTDLAFRSMLSGLIVVAATLDYETTPVYNFTIVAFDDGGNYDTARVIVTVEDVNDNKPVFDELFYTETIPEDLNLGRVVQAVRAIDIDSGDSGVVTYRIAGGNDDQTFEINEMNGIVTLTGVLDREEIDFYSLAIEAIDRGVTAQTGTAVLNITVSDVNDNPPDFTRDQYYGFVRETAMPGDTVYNGSITSGQPLILEVVDPDVNDSVTILSFPPAEFSVNSLTGAVTVASYLDHDMEAAEYQFTAFARDELFQYSRPILVIISVLPVNEHPPEFDEDIYEESVAENTGNKEVIFTVLAIDMDLGDSVVYSIVTDFNSSELTFPELTSAIGSGSGDNVFFIDEDPAMNRTFPFEINNATGEISLITILDFEVKQEWEFTVVATDLEGFQDNATVIVTVLDDNDNSPRFTDHLYRIDVLENATIPSQYPVSTVIKATDLDSISQDHIRYYILSGSGEAFEINRTSGDLYLVGSLDATDTQVYRLQLLVSDGMREDSALAIITVVDINNNGPVFEFSEYSATLPENATRDTFVLQVKAEDDDLSMFGDVYYQLTSGNTDQFYINLVSGDIFTNNTQAFDFESPDKEYQLEVKAYDGGNPTRCSYVNVTIILEDVNDETPRFIEAEFFVNVSESVIVGTVIFQLLAEDDDSGLNEEIVYDILTVNSSFRVDPETGNVLVDTELDYDPPNMQRTIELDILATDRGSPPRASNGTLTITVTDSNDNAPYFENALLQVFVPENITVNSPAFTIEAIDIDSGDNGRLTYVVLDTFPTECSMRYTLMPSGVLILSEELDAEERSQPCTIVIRATDLGTPQRSTQATFIFTVSDINENAPVFATESLLGSVLENSMNGTYVITVQTTDQDENAVVYFATGGDTGSFLIDEDTGDITVAYGATLDRENRSQYSLTVEARDNGIPAMTATATVVITLDDENDSPPLFPMRVYYIDLRENQPVDINFMTIMALDLDQFPNNQLTYTFLPNSENETDYGIFVVDENTGGLQLSTRLNYDQSDRHFFFLRVQANDSVAMDTARVNIRVLESNDETPIFTNLPNATNLREDAGNETFVFQVYAQDIDLGVNGEVSYSLEYTPYSDRFRIDNETGEIFVNGNMLFDFEFGVRTIVLMVRAMDNAGANTTGDNEAPQGSGVFSGYGGFDPNTPLVTPDDPIMFTIRSLTVFITDVNDNPPEFSVESYVSVIIEHPSPVNLRVTTVSAFDIDEPGTNNSAVRYTLTGEGSERFTINEITGEIDTNPPIDRETNPNFIIDVVAYDLGVPSLNSSVELLVVVLGLDDERPTFTRPFYNGEVYENSPRGTSVVTVEAIDLDSPDPTETNETQVTYNLFDSTFFMINSTSGEIQTTSVAIDREVTQNFNFTVQAVDSEGRSETATVFITVLDRNDEAPTFEQPKFYPFNISENTPLGTVLPGIEAPDRDDGSNAIAQYRIVVANGREGVFAVDPVEGDVYVENPLCFSDSVTQSYSVFLIATDSLDDSLNDTATITVNVYKENAHAPEFAQPSYVSRLDKEAKNGTIVIDTLRTIDLDTCSMYRPPTYEIIEGNVNDTFEIDPVSGVIALTRDLTDDDLSFTLTVKATDVGNFHLMNRSSEVNVIVLIGQLLPVSISVENGFTVATVSRDSQFEYQQDVWLFNGGSTIDQPPTVHYFLGNLEAEKEVEVAPSPAVSVTASLTHNRIYSDPGYVVVGLQVGGDGFEVANVQPTVVYVRVENDLGDSIVDSCITEPPSSTCVVNAAVPQEWFTNSLSNLTANVYYRTQTLSESQLGAITLVSPNNCSATPTQDEVRIFLPFRVVYPGDDIVVLVQSIAGGGTGSYHIVFELSDSLNVVDVQAPAHYIIQWATLDERLSISALNTDSNPLTVEDVLLITLHVFEDAPVVRGEPLRLDCTVLYLVDGTGNQVITDEPAVHIDYNEDGSCNSTTGEILTEPHSVVSLLAYANTPSILNTAVINGNAAYTPLTTLGLLNSGSFTNIVTNVTCESGDTDVLKVSEDCSSVFVNGSEAQGSERVQIYLTWYNPISTISSQVETSFRVWYPTGMVVNPTDLELSPIANVFDNQNSCRQVYESTKVEVQAVFVAGDRRQSVVITPLVLDLAYSTDNDVIELKTDTLQYTIRAVGVSPGSSSISINLFGAEVTPATINVTSPTVTVDDINFNLHVRLVPDSLDISTSGLPYLDTAVVSLETVPRYINTPVDVLTEAVLSNGRNFELSDSQGLELVSGNREVFQESTYNSDIFLVRGSGTGRFLEGRISGCSGISIPAFEFVDFNLESVSGLNVTLGSTTLAVPEHSEVLNLPSQTELQVSLIHSDGMQVPVSDDPRTVFVYPPQLNITDNRILETVGGSGVVAFTVSYQLAEDAPTETVGTITVLAITELQLSAHPQPYYNGSADTNSPVARRYANTSYYQKLELRLTAVLSDNTTRDISGQLTSDTTQVTLSNINAVLNGAVLIPQGSGNGTVTVFFGGLQSEIEVSVLDSEVTAITIEAFSVPLENGVLRGVHRMTFVPMLTLSFSDGSLYPNFLSPDGPALPGIVNFTSSSSSYLEIDSDTGVVELLYNSWQDMVTLNASLPNGTSSSLPPLFVDIQSRLGEVDVEGLVQDLPSGNNTFEVQLYVNTEEKELGAAEFEIQFNSSSWSLLDVQLGEGFSENAGIYQTFEVEEGRYRVAAVLGSPLSGSPQLHVTTLVFEFQTSEGQYFNVLVNTLNDFNNSYVPIGDPTPRYSIPASLSLPPNITLTPPPRCDAVPCPPETCFDLRGYIPAGDANGDCVFDLVDALYVKEAIPLVPIISPEFDDLLFQQQLVSLDADRNGRVEPQDIGFLVDAKLGIHALVQDITVRPIDAQFSDCRLTAYVTLQDESGRFPDNTSVYFGIFSQNTSFQFEYDNTSLSKGYKLSSVGLPSDAYGGWLLPEYTNGTYTIQTNPGIIAQKDLGFVVVYRTSDSLSEDRIVILMGHPTLPFQYGPLSASFPSGLSITLDSFNPQQLFDNSFPAEQCYNDNSPQITQPTEDSVIRVRREDVAINGTLVTVEAMDVDSGAAGDVAYRLVDVSQSGTLDIDPNTGVLFVSGTLDRESYDRVTATIVAEDQGPHIFTRRNDSVSFILLVDDYNDNAPIADQPVYNAAISEGVSVPSGGQSIPVFEFKGRDGDVDTDNQGIGMVSIIAANSTQNQTFQVSASSIDSQGGSRFTGYLTLIQRLDREIEDTYNLTVTISDAGIPPQTSQFTILVNVTDTNDRRPIFTSPDEATVLENQPAGTPVLTVEAFDIDLGSNMEFTFEISTVFEADDLGHDLGNSVNLDGYFTIGNTTGILATSRELDREGIHSFRITVFAVEEGIPKGSAFDSIWVMVCEQNDNKPLFPQSEYNASMVENAPDGRSVTQLRANDADLGPFCSGDTLQEESNVTRYNLLTDNVPFVIDAVTGIVSVNGSLDYEEITNYTMTVEVHDLGVPSGTSTTSLTINIVDANDNPPVLDNEIYYDIVVENSTIGTMVIDYISATDADSGINKMFRFNLTGEGSEDFRIDPETAVISTALLLNREVRPEYNLTVIAYDLGTPTLNDTALVNIKLVDINDEPPIFSQTSYYVEVSENTPLGEVVLTVLAEDSDILFNRIITYAFSGTPPTLFVVDRFSGQINTTGLLCNNGNVTYRFLVRAEDTPGGTLQFASEVNVTVLVYDDNTFEPEFTREEYASIIPRDAGSDTSVITVVATDIDVCSPPFIYSISSSPYFTIDNSTGVITTTAQIADATEAFYQLSVYATDSGTPNPLTGTAVVYLLIGETVPVDFSTSHGYPIGAVEANSPTYQQTFEYFYELSKFDTDGRAQVTFGANLESEQRFDVSLLPATRLNALLLTPTVYYNGPQVKVALQALDELGSTAVEDAEVYISAQYGSQVEYTMITTRLASLALDLPQSWFNFPDNETRSVNVSYGVVGQPATLFTQLVTLVPTPDYSSACTSVNPLVIVDVPQYTLYNQQKFEVPILAYRDESNTLSALALTCQLPSTGVEFTESFVVAGDPWVMQYEIDSVQTTLTLSASRIATEPLAYPGGYYETILSLQLKVTGVDPDTAAIVCEQLSAVDTDGNFDSYQLAVSDRNGCQSNSGDLYLSQNVLVGAFASSDQTVIFNDAVFTGEPQAIYPDVVGVFLAAEPMFLTSRDFSSPSGFTCWSDNDNILKAVKQFQDCRVHVDGTEQAGSDAVFVFFDVSPSGDFTVAPGIFPVSLAFQTWYPDIPISLWAVDSELNLVDGWTAEDYNPQCSQAYQRTTLEATATFSTSVENVTVRVEHLLTFRSDQEPTFIAIDGAQVVGVAETGTALIEAMQPTLNNILGTTMVSVVSDPVRVVELDVIHSTDLTLTLPDTIPYRGTGPFQAQLNPYLQYETQTAHLVSTAVFSDGTRYRLPTSLALSYTSRNTSIIEVTNSEFTALNRGEGDLLEVTFRGCDGQTVISELSPLDISLLEPVIRVDITPDQMLVRSDDPAADLIEYFSTSVTVTATLVYDLGDGIKKELSITDSAEFTLSPGGILVMTDGTNAKIIEPSLSYPNASAVNLTVTYKSYQAVTRVLNLGQTVGFEATAQPTPNVTHSTLYIIGNTGVFQQAEIITQLFVEEPLGTASISLTADPSLEYRVIGSNFVTVSDSGILTPVIPGSTEIETKFGELTDLLTIEVTSLQVVSVAAIDRLELSTGTSLSGLPGTVSAVISASLTLSDGAYYDEFYNQIEGGQLVSGLLVAVSNSPDIFTINSATGRLTIHDNAVDTVSLSVTANDETRLQRVLDFSANLQPGEGELDLGQANGPPVPPVQPGDTFIVPLWMNVEVGASIGAIEVAIAYSSSLLELVSTSSGANVLEIGFFASSGREFNGFVHLGAILAEELSSGLVHLANLEFRARDNENGVAAIRATTVTLLDLDSQALPTASESPAAFVGVAVGNVQLQIRPDLQVPLNTYLSSSVETTPLCTGGRETGDLNGDCIFNFEDLGYLLRNGPCISNQDTDFDHDGECTLYDLFYLISIYFRQTVFIQSVTVTPVNVTDCFLTINTMVLTKGDELPDPERTSVLIGLIHRDSDFQMAVDASVPVLNFGQPVAIVGDLPASVNGGFFQARYSDGAYRLVLDTHIGKSDVGLVVILAHTDAYGLLDENREWVLAGANTIPYQFPESLATYVEHPTGYNISIVAPLGFNPFLSFNQTFSSPDCINVNEPIFFPQTTVAEVYENLENGSIVARVYANDSDAGPNAQLIYSFDESTITQEIRDTFEINETSGDVILLSTLDRETTEFYTIGVRARDQGILATLGGFGELVIVVLDVNDNAPRFDNTIYFPSPVAEDLYSPNELYIVDTIIAEDGDLGENGTIYYTLLEPYDFGINSSTGEIYIASALDYESITQYNLTVVAEDGGSPPLNGSTIVVVNIDPVNDNTPNCNPINQQVVLLEDVFNGSVVVTVNASDSDDGADHAELSFTIYPPSDQFGIRDIVDENKAEIFTITEGFSRAATPEITITILVSDVGGRNCSIVLTIVIGESSRLDFQIERPGAGFLLGAPKRQRTGDGFDQRVGFFSNSYENGIITSSLSGVNGSTQFARELRAPESVDVVLQDSEVWFDSPVVRAVVQLRDSYFSTRVRESSVTLEAVPTNSSGAIKTGNPCERMEDNGVCVLSVELPMEWFDMYESVEISVLSDGSALSPSPATVLLRPRLDLEVPDDELIVQVPSYNLHPNENFTIWVGTVVGATVSSYQLELETSSNIALGPVSTVPGWSCQESGTGLKSQYICLKLSDEAPVLSEVGIQYLLSVETSIGGTIGPNIITATTIFVQFDSGLVIGSRRSSAVIDRDGLRMDGKPKLYIQPSTTRGILAWAERPELINTSPLSGTAVTSPITVLAVTNHPLLPYGVITSGLNCSSDTDIVIISPGYCSSVELSSPTTSKGAEETIITISYESFEFNIPLRVWYPLSAQLAVPDTVLNEVKFWLICPSVIEYQYQEIRVTATAQFTTGVVNSSFVDVTEFATLVSSDPTVVNVNGRVIKGQADGFANISIYGYPGAVIEIEATSSRTTSAFSISAIFTSINLAASPMTYSSTDQLTASATIAQNFNDVGIEGYPMLTVYFTDGVRYDVPRENLEVLSMDPDIAIYSEARTAVISVAPGTAEFIINWKNSCPSHAILTTHSTVVVTVPVILPERLEIQLSSPALKGMTQGLSLTSASLESEVTVLLYYSDGSFENITNLATLDTSESLQVTTDPQSGAQIILATPSTAATSGYVAASYIVDNATFADNKTVVIIHVVDIVTTVQPYPNPSNEPPTFQIALERVANTTYWQQARIMTEAVLSDGTREEIVASYTDLTGGPDIPLSGVITPMDGQDGTFTVTGSTSSGTSNAVTITVEDTAATVQSIRLELQDLGTVTEKRVVANVTFMDGTEINDILTNPQFADLLTFVLDPPTAANISTSTATLTIIGNHYDEVTLIARPSLSDPDDLMLRESNPVTFTANLSPQVGDIDLGEETGIPQAPIPAGQEFTVDVRLSVGASINVGALDLLITYDPDVLEYISATVAGYSAVRAQSPRGELQIVTANFPVDSDTPTVAQVTFRVHAGAPSGPTAINSNLGVLTDDSYGVIGSGDETSKTGSLIVLVDSGTLKRDATSFVRTPVSNRARRDTNTYGDVNGDGCFDIRDAALVGQSLFDPSVDLTSTQEEEADVDKDGLVTLSDFNYLLQAAVGNLPFLVDWSISKVSPSENCLLGFSVTLAEGPGNNYTFVFIVLSHPSFADLLNVSRAEVGERILITDSTSGIFEAYPLDSDPDEYRLSLYTPIDFQSENFGVTIVLFTTDQDYSTSSERHANFIKVRNTTLIGSGVLVPEIRGIDLKSSRISSAQISGVSIGEPDGFSPLEISNNSLRSDYCNFQDSIIEIQVNESQVLDQTFATISAVDSRFPSNGERYELTSTSNVFNLSLTGELSLIASLDYDEGITNYVLEVSASAPSITSDLGTVTINITVLDVNDNEPIFDAVTYFVNVSEDEVVGREIAIIAASDLDSGLNGMFSFSILPDSDPETQFSIQMFSDTEGNLSVAKALDRETTAEYNLVILATDFGEPTRSSNRTVYVTVLDVNDNSPNFDRLEYFGNVAENFFNATLDKAIPDLVIVVSDTDAGNNSVVTLELLNASTLPFELYQSGNVTTILVTGELDRETVASYQLTVVARDNGSPLQLTNSTTVTITINDVNDNAPMFSLDNPIMVLVEEDLPAGTVVTQITATDNDTGANGEIRYDIAESNVPFEINDISGEINISVPLDINTAHQYNLTILATDQGVDPRSDEWMLTINIIEGQVVSFDVGTSGYSIDTPSRINSGYTYSQDVGYLFGEEIGSPATVTGRINTATMGEFDIVEIPNIGDEATQFRATVMQEDVKHSLRAVTVFVQALDARDTIPEPTFMRVRVVASEALSGPVSQVDTFCTTSSELGYCIAQAILPDEWFVRGESSSPRFVDVYASFASAAEDDNGELLLQLLNVELSPAYEDNFVTQISPVALLVPSHTIFPGQQFTVEVHALSPIGDLQYNRAEFDVAPGFGMPINISYDEEQWDCSE